MKTLRLVLLVLPWILLVGLISYTQFSNNGDQETPVTINVNAVLKEVESLGKLELVRYNFKEITEVEELSKKYLNVFQLGPDSKIALISEGEAVGCLDLTKIAIEDLTIHNDTVYIQLPKPEVCYYKLNMDKTRIYSLQTNPLKDEKKFIQKAYKSAENEIKQAALNSGILLQTQINAELILRPMLEKMSGRQVVFIEKPKSDTVILD